MDKSIGIMRDHGVAVENLRTIDLDLATGVWPDMTEHGWGSDEWPRVFEKVMAADILVIGTPIWLGEKSSVCTKLIERLYGNSSLLNENGQYAYYGRVGGCLITGNEDGIKHCSMNILYSLQHLGYTIPPQADAGLDRRGGPRPLLRRRGDRTRQRFHQPEHVFHDPQPVACRTPAQGQRRLPRLRQSAL